jgi:AcrR family transcriptional regulator
MPNKPRLPGRRSQAEALRTRARILDRAERLFARRGYRGVSLRELARACGVRPFTIQHHFGSKLRLYQAVLCRWDEEILARVSRALDASGDFPALVERVVDDLFDFLLERRDWVALTARAALGEGLPRSLALEDHGWVRVMDAGLRQRGVGPRELDLRLLLVTLEGMLHHHVLSVAHYRQLFGRDVTEPRLRARTKAHLRNAILALVAPRPRSRGEAARERPGRRMWVG